MRALFTAVAAFFALAAPASAVSPNLVVSQVYGGGSNTGATHTHDFIEICNGGSAVCTADQLARIIDRVGYGNANFFEGSAAAPALTSSTAAARAGNGC